MWPNWNPGREHTEKLRKQSRAQAAVPKETADLPAWPAQRVRHGNFEDLRTVVKPTSRRQLAENAPSGTKQHAIRFKGSKVQMTPADVQ
jgi:hypothetical protein